MCWSDVGLYRCLYWVVMVGQDLGQKGEDLYGFLDARTQTFSPVPSTSDTKSKPEYFHASFSLRMLTGHLLMSVSSQLLQCKLSLSATGQCLSGDLFHIKRPASALSNPSINLEKNLYCQQQLYMPLRA